MFEYLDLYRNSLSEDTEIEYVEELIKYYENNREGLLPYQSQGLELPKNPDGLEYRNMGIMENHVWSVIEKRMKHNQSYQLEQAWRKSSGEDTGKKMQRKAVWSNRKAKTASIWGRKGRRTIWRDIAVSEGTEERQKRIWISSIWSCSRTGKKNLRVWMKRERVCSGIYFPDRRTVNHVWKRLSTITWQ